MHSTDEAIQVFNEERASEFERAPRPPDDWQAAIREAQSKKIEAELAASKQREEELAREQRELGEKLARALGFFGIEIEPQERNLAVLGDYEFSLLERDLYDGYWPRARAYHESGDGKVRFTLYVAPRGWHDADEMDWITEVNQESITVKDRAVDGDWSRERAVLADKLDSLKFHVGLERERAARQAAAPKPDDKRTAPVSQDGLGVLASRIEGDSNYNPPTDVATAMALLDIAHSLRQLLAVIDNIANHGLVTYPEP